VGFGFPLDTDELLKLRGNTVALSLVVKAGANFSAGGAALGGALCVGTGAAPAKRGTASPHTGEASPINTTTNLTPGGAATKVTFISSSIATNISQAEILIFYSAAGTAGADDSFTIDDVDLRVIPALTAVNPTFERSDYGFDWLRCQRFLVAFNAPAASGLVGAGQAFTTT